MTIFRLFFARGQWLSWLATCSVVNATYEFKSHTIHAILHTLLCTVRPDPTLELAACPMAQCKLPTHLFCSGGNGFKPVIGHTLFLFSAPFDPSSYFRLHRRIYRRPNALFNTCFKGRSPWPNPPLAKKILKAFFQVRRPIFALRPFCLVGQYFSSYGRPFTNFAKFMAIIWMKSPNLAKKSLPDKKWGEMA